MSRLIGLMLENQMGMADQYRQAHQHWLRTMAQFKEQHGGIDATGRWSREETNQRGQ